MPSQSKALFYTHPPTHLTRPHLNFSIECSDSWFRTMRWDLKVLMFIYTQLKNIPMFARAPGLMWTTGLHDLQKAALWPETQLTVEQIRGQKLIKLKCFGLRFVNKGHQLLLYVLISIFTHLKTYRHQVILIRGFTERTSTFAKGVFLF